MKFFPATRRARIRLAIIAGFFLALQFFLIGCIMFGMNMPGRSHTGPLAPLTDEERRIRDRLRAHVQKLAGEIGIRELWDHEKSLNAAAAYIRPELEALGYAVNELPYTALRKTAKNLEVEVKGRARPDEIFVVGAHYDTMWETPGADDNASAVAALLEIARLLRGRSFDRTLRLVAFTNEEPPHFQTETMGSLVYARACRQRGDKITGMIALESIGYYRDTPKSQQYPYPFNLVYPSTGDFIGFVGNIESRALVRSAVGAFRRLAAFPSEGTAAPGFIQGIGWSDQWAFWQVGYPALMVTDTAPFRNPNYHTPGDTPETLDYERTARVTAGMAAVVAELAGAGK